MIIAETKNDQVIRNILGSEHVKLNQQNLWHNVDCTKMNLDSSFLFYKKKYKSGIQ